MDIDGYDGSELAPLDNAEIDNSLTANVNQMFDITSVETNDNLNNMGNELEDNSTERNVETMENSQSSSSSTNTTNSTNTTKNTDIKVSKSTTNTLVGVGIFLLVWVIVGTIAFIISLFCFGFSGSITEKIIGLVLAIFFGPFYFIYFYLNKNYCGRKSSNNVKSD